MGKKRKFDELAGDGDSVLSYTPADDVESSSSEHKKKKKKHKHRDDDFDDSGVADSSSNERAFKRPRLDFDSSELNERTPASKGVGRTTRWLIRKPLEISLEDLAKVQLRFPSRPSSAGITQHFELISPEGRVQKFEAVFKRAQSQLVHIPIPLDNTKRLQPEASVPGVVFITRTDLLDEDTEQIAKNLEEIKKPPPSHHIWQSRERLKAFGARISKRKRLPSLAINKVKIESDT